MIDFNYQLGNSQNSYKELIGVIYTQFTFIKTQEKIL